MSIEADRIAQLLVEIGRRSVLRGGNPYRAKAFRRAAENLAVVTEPLDRLIAEKRLQEVPGVGPSIAGVIEELYRTGSHPALEPRPEDVPPSALALLDVPGLRAEKAARLVRDLGITSLEGLSGAIESGALRKAKGFGKAFEAKMAEALETLRAGEGRRHIHKATALVDELARNLKRVRSSVAEIHVAGDVRRGLELAGDLSLVGIEPGRKHAERLAVASGVAVHLTSKALFGTTLLFATGSKTHLAQLQERAQALGCRLAPDGLWRGRKRLASASEAHIYEALELRFIAPELREGRGEIEQALSGALPVLVENDDITGILHAHTTRSDGVATLEAMAQAVRSRGYAYFGVADHSRSAHYAGGLSIDDVAEQRAEVEALNRRYRGGFHVLAGIESDILADGSLDYPDEILAGFDFVVASVHGRFRLDRAAQTKRVLAAIAHPATTILGHPTGRQLLRRPGYDIDLEAVLKACAAHGVAVEINGNPWRLDLDWRWHARALELGCMLSINPDAHSIAEIDLLRWGVVMARKGGVPKERVLNCMSLRDLQAWLVERRSSKQPKRRRRA